MIPIFMAGMLLCGSVSVNVDALIWIESRGNPKAFNKHSHSRGILQITPVVAQEWDNHHSKERLTDLNDLLFPAVSLKVGRWYLSERIPEMLHHFKKPVTLRNILICWNAGINYVVHPEKELPLETVEYIAKYHEITSH